MDIKNLNWSLKPDPKSLKSDLVAGFATGLFSIPEGMAYAKLAGVNPLYGMYSGNATDKRWENWLTAIANPFYAKEAKFFHPEEKDKAWFWLQEGG